jgi:hypothetical protein
MMLGFGDPLRDARPLFVCLSLAFAVIGALAILLSVASPAAAQGAIDCASEEKPQVPGAVEQSADCLTDLTTRTLRLDADHTSLGDWEGLHAPETTNPAGDPPGPSNPLIPGL